MDNMTAFEQQSIEREDRWRITVKFYMESLDEKSVRDLLENTYGITYGVLAAYSNDETPQLEELRTFIQEYINQRFGTRVKRSAEIQTQRDRMYHIMGKAGKVRNQKILFDIDAHKMCADLCLIQAEETYATTGTIGQHLADATLHLTRMREFVDFYAEEE